MAFDAYLRFFFALVFVLALIALLAWLAKRFGFAGAFARPRSDRRLSLVESLSLDARHRLVLVRRDRIEHLVLLGAGGDSLIESAIEPPPAPPEERSSPPVSKGGGA
jgi:flagellar protein FliO/FliZ